MSSKYSIYFPLSGEFSRLTLGKNKSLAQKVFKKHHKPKDEDRPVCLCSAERPKMQIYLHSNGFYHLKRNPKTGELHDGGCGSYGETVESYGCTDFQSAVSLEIDEKKKIRVVSSLTIAEKGELAESDEGGVKRSQRQYNRATLKGFFEFLWHEIGMLEKKENEKAHYKDIVGRIHAISKNLKYNATLVSEVLIIPNGLSGKGQKDLIYKLSLSENGGSPKTRVLVLGLLNRVEIDDAGRCVIQLWNAPDYDSEEYSPKKTIKYYTTEALARKILKTIHIKDNVYEFDKSSRNGYSWLIATAQPHTSEKSGYCYPVIKDAEVVSVSEEHVPIELGKTIVDD